MNAEIDKKNKIAADEKKAAEAVLLFENQKRETYKMTGDAMNALGEVVGRQTIAGKALAVAQALINTYLGVTEVLRNKTIIPEPFGTIQKVASVATMLCIRPRESPGIPVVRCWMRSKVGGKNLILLDIRGWACN